MNQVTSKDGTKIAYDQTGSGPTLILVGGAFQTRQDPMMGPLAQQLSEHFTVVNYDRRGRGDSTDTQPYEVWREVEDIEAIIDAVGESACLFGMSSGSVLALDAATRLGGKVKKVAVYEAPFIVDDSRPPVSQDYLDTLKKMIAEGRNGDAVEYFMTGPAGVPAEYVGGMRSQPFWSAMEAVAPTLVYDGTLMATMMSGKPLEAEFTNLWAAIKAPVLVLDGGASPAHMHSAAEALAKVLADAQRRTLDGQSHDVAPDVLAPVLGAFFRA